jgi:hypothetical protein
MCFSTIGCTTKIKKALAKIVAANRATNGEGMEVGSLLGFLEWIERGFRNRMRFRAPCYTTRTQIAIHCEVEGAIVSLPSAVCG